MSLNYCAHFIKSARNPAVVRSEFEETLFTTDDSPWLVGNYSEPQSDQVYEPDCSLIKDLSQRAGAEVVFIFVDGMTDMFRYEHAHHGNLLRKLLFLNNGTVTLWLAVEGSPEPWEDQLIFSDQALQKALQSGFIKTDSQRADVKQLYQAKRFKINDIWPLCDVEVLAFGIQKYYGMVLPPHRNWTAE